MNGPKAHDWINELDVYISGKSETIHAAKSIKLSANESALGPSPMAMAAYVNEAQKLHRYPDPAYNKLRQTIAERYALDMKRIICGVGSDEILKLACRAYLKPDDEALYVAHSFSMYPIAIKSVGGVAIEVADHNYTANIDAILASISDKTRIIFLANPNNPTGTYLPKAEIDRLWMNIPDNVLLVLDAAYAEFVDQKDYEAGIELVERSKNVLMTRTFSKLYGIAALRLGWGYTCEEISQILDKVRDPFNIPSSAQVAGVAALKDTEFEEMALAYNNKWRTWLTEQITTLGLTVVPSQTNFILIKFEDRDKSAAAANDYLLSHGYILRYYSSGGLEDCLRLTVGLEGENKEVVKLLKAFLGN